MNGEVQILSGAAPDLSGGLLMQPCPSCHHPIPINSGFATWCEQCGWNLKPHAPLESGGFLGRVYQRIGSRRGASLLQTLRAAQDQPPVDFAVVASYILAGAVLLLDVVFLALGVWLLTTGWPRLIPILVAILCFGAVWLARPRFGKASPYAVDRTACPTLHALIDRVAGSVGVRPPSAVAIDWRFSASYRKVGWRGRSELQLGLPLLITLEGQEFVALVGHELAHGRRGDLGYSTWVSVAVRSLVLWSNFLRPLAIFDPEQGLAGILMVPVNLLGYALSYVPMALAWLLAHLIWARSQRAEYMADALGAQVGGAAGMVGVLEKTQYEDAFLRQVERVMRAHEPDFYSWWAACVAAIPERERERIRRSQCLADSRLDDTHPPTAYRLELLRSRPSVKSQVILTAQEQTALAAELRPLRRVTQAELLSNYAGLLYRIQG